LNDFDIVEFIFIVFVENGLICIGHEFILLVNFIIK